MTRHTIHYTPRPSFEHPKARPNLFFSSTFFCATQDFQPNAWISLADFDLDRPNPGNLPVVSLDRTGID
jgi:hypothetical protein